MIKTLLLGCGGLGLAAATWALLLPDAKQTTAQVKPPVAAVVATASAEQTAPRAVRVVYPGPDTSDARIKLAERVLPGAPAPAVETPAPAAPPVAARPTPDPIDAQASAAKTPPTASPEAAVPTPAAAQTININSASIDAMDHLPGAGRIGLAIARHRPYRSVEDLLNKRVVRKSVYEKIRVQLAAE